MTRSPPRSPLFPYTTLFRSVAVRVLGVQRLGDQVVGGADDRLAPGQLVGDLGEFPERADLPGQVVEADPAVDRKSTRLNSSHVSISYAVFCLKKKIVSFIESIESSAILPFYSQYLPLCSLKRGLPLFPSHHVRSFNWSATLVSFS